MALPLTGHTARMMIDAACGAKPVKTEEQCLLEAIQDSPAEDTPRLAYADWCDENGRPDRAEFVRLQVRPNARDVSRCECGSVWAQRYKLTEPRLVSRCRSCRKEGPAWDDITADRDRAVREAELFRTAAARGPDGVTTAYQIDARLRVRRAIYRDRMVDEVWSTPIGVPPGFRPPDVELFWKRGFVEEVRLTAEVFFGRPCPECQYVNKTRYFGFDRFGPGCPHCRGTCFFGGLAVDLFLTNPVARVVITDLVAEPIPPHLRAGWTTHRLSTATRQVPDDIKANGLVFTSAGAAANWVSARAWDWAFRARATLRARNG